LAENDLVRGIYETVRLEALQRSKPASYFLELVRLYGVASLFPCFQDDFPFILYVQSVPRPAWSGWKDFHQETLHRAYEFLTEELEEDERSPLSQCIQIEKREGTEVRFISFPGGVDQNASSHLCAGFY
jgi:hypothetical protein